MVRQGSAKALSPVRTQSAMFFLGNGTTGFGGVFRPEFFGEDGGG